MLLFSVATIVFACIFAQDSVCDDLSKEYEHAAFLDSVEVYKLYWTVSHKEKLIHLAVEVKTTGWVGFGISKGLTGSMKGADIVIGWVDSAGKGHLSDRYSTSNSMPLVDEKQDYQLVAASQTNGTTVLKFKRKLVTCDKDDNDIAQGTIKVIYAYGKSDDVKYHGHISRGSRSVNLLSYVKNVPLPATAKSFDVVVTNISVPAKETTYWCQAFKLSLLVKLNGTRHIIEIGPVIEDRHRGVVHHITLYSCPENFNDSHLYKSGPCSNPDMPLPVRECSTGFSQTYAWGIGAGNFKLPEHVGMDIGAPYSMKYVVLEIHFNNPSLYPDFVVTTGLRFYYDKPRKYEAGMFMTGASATGNMVIPPRQKGWITTGYCSKECSAKIAGPGALNGNEIKLFSSYLHTHNAGVGIWTKHVRDGAELPEIARNNNFDSNYQQTHLLSREIPFKAGDELITQCRYSTMKRKDATIGGLASTQEMCLNFMMYYPRVNLTSCFSHNNLVAKIFSQRYAKPVWVDDPFRPFNKSLPPAPFQFSNWTNIKWNNSMIQELKDTYALNNHYVLTGFCYAPFGHRYKGILSRKTVIVKKLKSRENICVKTHSFAPRASFDNFLLLITSILVFLPKIDIKSEF